MSLDMQEIKLRIARYLFIIQTRFDIKREYLTLGVPIFLAILFLLGLLLTGHTFPDGKVKDTTVSESTSLDDYYTLVEMKVGEGENSSNVPMAGIIPEKKNSSKDDMDQMLVLAFVLATTPYTFDIYWQKRVLRRKERAFSDFLYRLSELMRGGIDPIKGIISLSRGELGAIQKDIQECATLLVLGHSLQESMNRLDESIGSKLISKYTRILVKAAHTGGNVADLIFRTSEDLRAVISLQKEKENNLMQYTLIFYLAQGIIIMLVYELSGSLLSLLQGGSGMSAMGGKMSFGGLGGGHGSSISSINFKLGFFHMIILNALLGGLIIGMITEGQIKQGLKHANILLIASYIAAIMLILAPAQAPTYNIKVVSGGNQSIDLGSHPSPILFSVTDSSGKPVKDVSVKVRVTPDGTANGGKTNKKGQVSISPELGDEEGAYRIVAVAGRSYNTTIITKKGVVNNL